MKFILLGFVLLSGTSFGQTIDLATLKGLMTARKASLELVNAGMSKKLVTKAKATEAQGICEYTVTSTQSILKIEGSKMIMFTQESFAPAASVACQSAGYEAFQESILFYEDKPSLEVDFADLDISAPSIRSIIKSGEIITLNLHITDEDYSDQVVIKYDLSKPSFKNLILSQGLEYSTISTDLPDLDLSKVDLTKVLFCENNDGDLSECVEGNYSDILF